MLGREVSDIRCHGATTFGKTEHAIEEHDDVAPVLHGQAMTSAQRLKGVSVSIRPGEVVGLAGLLGSGRSETARAILGALPVESGTLTIGGRSVATGNMGAAMRAGVSMLAEDRKTEGTIPHLSIRENIVLAALPRLSRFGIVSRARQDRIVDTFMTRLRIKASSPDQKVVELSGRGIDVGAKAEVQALIDELAADGLAVLLISSEIEELVDGSSC